MQHIRGRLRQWFGADAAEKCHILYGGSVKPDNVADLMREPDVDGALVGGREPGCARLRGDRDKEPDRYGIIGGFRKTGMFSTTF